MVDVELDQQPVEVEEGDVLSGYGSRENPGS